MAFQNKENRQFDTANVFYYEYTVCSSPMEKISALKNTGCHKGQSLFYSSQKDMVNQQKCLLMIVHCVLLQRTVERVGFVYCGEEKVLERLH